MRHNSPNHRIHFYAFHVVELLQRILNLLLVTLDIAYEYQRVVLLDLLHR